MFATLNFIHSFYIHYNYLFIPLFINTIKHWEIHSILSIILLFILPLIDLESYFFTIISFNLSFILPSLAVLHFLWSKTSFPLIIYSMIIAWIKNIAYSYHLVRLLFIQSLVLKHNTFCYLLAYLFDKFYQYTLACMNNWNHWSDHCNRLYSNMGSICIHQFLKVNH